MLLIVLRPVIGSWLMKCEIWYKYLVSNRLNDPYFLNRNLYWSKSVGRADLERIIILSSFNAGLSSSSSSGSFKRRLKNDGNTFVNFSAATYFSSCRLRNLRRWSSSERNYEGRELGKILSQKGSRSSAPGIIKKNENGIIFRKSSFTFLSRLYCKDETSLKRSWLYF